MIISNKDIFHILPQIGSDTMQGVIILITANSYIKTNGSLVMGDGAAKALSDNLPWTSKSFGACVMDICGHLGEYNLIIKSINGVGLFQTKFHYKDKSDLGLISRSCNCLNDRAKLSPKITFHLNYPGIGYGGLTETEVYPLIEKLPDNVIIYKK